MKKTLIFGILTIIVALFGINTMLSIYKPEYALKFSRKNESILIDSDYIRCNDYKGLITGDGLLNTAQYKLDLSNDKIYLDCEVFNGINDISNLSKLPKEKIVLGEMWIGATGVKDYTSEDVVYYNNLKKLDISVLSRFREAGYISMQNVKLADISVLGTINFQTSHSPFATRMIEHLEMDKNKSYINIFLNYVNLLDENYLDILEKNSTIDKVLITNSYIGKQWYDKVYLERIDGRLLSL